MEIQCFYFSIPKIMSFVWRISYHQSGVLFSTSFSRLIFCISYYQRDVFWTTEGYFKQIFRKTSKFLEVVNNNSSLQTFESIFGALVFKMFLVWTIFRLQKGVLLTTSFLNLIFRPVYPQENKFGNTADYSWTTFLENVIKTIFETWVFIMFLELKSSFLVDFFFSFPKWGI